VSFSWDINVGHIVMVVVPTLGVIVGYVTMRVKADANQVSTDNLKTRVDAYGTALADLRLHVESTCVKKDDLEKVEERLGRRLDTILALLTNQRDDRRPRP